MKTSLWFIKTTTCFSLNVPLKLKCRDMMGSFLLCWTDFEKYSQYSEKNSHWRWNSQQSLSAHRIKVRVADHFHVCCWVMWICGNVLCWCILKTKRKTPHTTAFRRMDWFCVDTLEENTTHAVWRQNMILCLNFRKRLSGCRRHSVFTR